MVGGNNSATGTPSGPQGLSINSQQVALTQVSKAGKGPGIFYLAPKKILDTFKGTGEVFISMMSELGKEKTKKKKKEKKETFKTSTRPVPVAIGQNADSNAGAPLVKPAGKKGTGIASSTKQYLSPFSPVKPISTKTWFEKFMTWMKSMVDQWREGRK